MLTRSKLRSVTVWFFIGASISMLSPEMGFSEGTFWVTFAAPHKFVVGQDNVFECQVLDADTHFRLDGVQVDVTGPDFAFSGTTNSDGILEYDDPIHPLVAGLVTIDITHPGYTSYHTGMMAQVGTADAWMVDCFGAEGMLPSWDINRNGVWDGPAVDCWPFDSPYIKIDLDC